MVCLGLTEVTEKHTGVFIADQIQNTLLDYNIDLTDPVQVRQLVGNTTDTAANERNAGFQFYMFFNILIFNINLIKVTKFYLWSGFHV